MEVIVEWSFNQIAIKDDAVIPFACDLHFDIEVDGHVKYTQHVANKAD
jgi:hypothetical protein